VDESDEELMDRCRVGDMVAFEVLVSRHMDGVTGHLARMVSDPNDAQDLAQDVFMKVYVNRQTYATDSRFTSWLYRIATNAAIDCLRRRAKRRFVSLSSAMPSHDEGSEATELHETLADPGSLAPPEILAVAESWAEVGRALESLSEKQRELFRLRSIEGLDYKTIGDRLGIGPETVRTRMHSLRQEIKRRMRWETQS
jgi:RNA polymerase sigma-70 factor (ECF subfamily)